MSQIPILEVENFSVSFTAGQTVTHAVDNISFSIYPGEILALVGESGSGKSVTALSILQLLPNHISTKQQGHIFFYDGNEKISITEAGFEKLKNIRGQKIGMVFQEPMSSLNPVQTCGRQVAESLIQHTDLSFIAAKQEAILLFAELALPEPEKIFDKYPHQLSGGQQQRVMIAMAICCQPALLICDEPTTALDTIVQKNLLQLIDSIRERYKMAVLFISHDLGVVAEIADKIAVLYNGKIVESGTTNAILTNPRQPYTKGLLLCRPALYAAHEKLPVVQDFIEDNISINKEAAMVADVKQQNTPTSFIPKDQKILLHVDAVSISYKSKNNYLTKKQKDFLAVEQVQFEIYEGETMGLVGASGCGKTTLGRAILGLQPISAGNIFFKGKNISKLSKEETRQLKSKMQIIFQDPYSSLDPMQKIGEAIAEPLKVHCPNMNCQAIKNKVFELLEKTGLDTSFYNRYPHACSGGQRQRIVIARALALEPAFVVCDESVSALDLSVQAQVLNLLNNLKEIFGFTALFISHDLSVVRYISDRIMVMEKGRIVEMGKTEEIYFHPKTVFTKQLLDAIPGKSYFELGKI